MNNVINNVKKIYDSGENIIKYLKSIDGREQNSVEDIMIAYDFQAGTSTEITKMYENVLEKRNTKIAKILSQYVDAKNVTIMEAGIGEATSFVPIMKKMLSYKAIEFKQIYGFDISWSRIKYAEKYIKESELAEYPINLFVGDLKNMPIKDNSVDMVYTVYAVQPNGGHEKELLQELYRVTGRYLILFESAYELANEESQKRMKYHGYVTNLYETAIELGYDVISYELLGYDVNPLDPAGVMIIEKKRNENYEVENALCDPISKQDIVIGDTEIYCSESMLVYPIIKGIPMLTKNNAILATKYNEF